MTTKDFVLDWAKDAACGLREVADQLDRYGTTRGDAIAEAQAHLRGIDLVIKLTGGARDHRTLLELCTIGEKLLRNADDGETTARATRLRHLAADFHAWPEPQAEESSHDEADPMNIPMPGRWFAQAAGINSKLLNEQARRKKLKVVKSDPSNLASDNLYPPAEVIRLNPQYRVLIENAVNPRKNRG